MSLRDIHLLGSPVLRQRSAEVGKVTDEVRAFIADLFDTMRASKGVGLAANQIGVATRVCVVETDAEHSYALVNPVIVEREDKDKDEEGCLSIPEIYGDVERSARVIVEALDENGRKRRIEATELLGRAIQHEIDHLDGILFIDRVGPLKRRSLIKKWEKSRKGEIGYIRKVDAPEPAAAGAKGADRAAEDAEKL
ncbi:MAG TPA: peptide deformylase [Gemmatimonadales bacterium]